MINLPNNCRCSMPSVNPKNWEKASSSLKKNWYIQYYFFDPAFKDKYPNGKFIVVKKGINFAKTLTERRAAVRFVLESLMDMLKNEGYNPITRTFLNENPNSDYEISPNLLLLEALNEALKRSEASHETKLNIQSTLKYFSKAAINLGYDTLRISEIKRKHIRFSLEHCAKVKSYWSNNLFNNYRRDLGMLFNELIRTETIEYNPIDKIEKKKVIKTIRDTLTPDERKQIDGFLKENYYNFWRFTQIFFHSGSRGSELMKVKRKDVDLLNQEFKVTIKKGKQGTETIKIIKDIALPLWEEMIYAAGEDDYLFSKDLLPGPIPISPRQVTGRWNRHVKVKLNINVDFYALKHANTTEVVEMVGEAAAAKLNSHTTLKMVSEIYDVNNQKRKNDMLKLINNPFA